MQQVTKQVGLDFKGAYVNLDGGFDSAPNRKYIFNTGLIPNIPEHPRNRRHPKRGRKRRLLRFEHIQQRPYGMKLLAYPLMNLRGFCDI